MTIPCGDHVVVYTRSALVEQTSPVASNLADVTAWATSLGFQDQDLDVGQIAGTLSWQPAGDVSAVGSWAVFLVESAAGSSRSQLGGALPADNVTKDLTADTAVSAFTHLAVYAASALEEATTPSTLTVADVNASVVLSAESLIDRDLDMGELGGVVTWQPTHIPEVPFRGMLQRRNGTI